MIGRSIRMGLLVGTMVALAGCGSSTASVTPSTAAGGAGASVEPSVVVRTQAPAQSPAAGQTDTEWGRIWDSLPKGFPVYTGATRSDETNLGPASAVETIEGPAAVDLIGWYDTQLEAAGYRVVALNGPMEDGGYTLDMTGPKTDCRLEVRVVPMGAGSDFLGIPIMYGADCPKP